MKYCLKFLCSLYGSTFAPCLWYEHLFKFLLEDGFQQSQYDPCLIFKRNILIIVYVDDAGIAAESEKIIDDLIKRLEEAGFGLTKEGSFSEYLGIQYIEDKETNKIHMCQKGLINKIIKSDSMTNCNSCATPTTNEALAKDPDGVEMTDPWNYRSIVGMLLYLANNTRRPDIAFTVSQVARFSYAPKQSHANAVKRIV